MHKRVTIVCALAMTWLVGSHALWAQQSEEKDRAELATALKGAKVSLLKGLSASEREGTPISGKFEVDDGKFQLSVYTQKGDTFSEVILDPATGKITEVNPITGGEDLTTAKAESEAMAKTKVSLRAAVDKALKANKGYRPVRVIPTLKDGHPVAEVTLTKGAAWKKISEQLE